MLPRACHENSCVGPAISASAVGRIPTETTKVMAGVFTKLWSGPGMNGETFLYRVDHDSEGLGLG